MIIFNHYCLFSTAHGSENSMNHFLAIFVQLLKSLRIELESRDIDFSDVNIPHNTQQSLQKMNSETGLSMQSSLSDIGTEGSDDEVSDNLEFYSNILSYMRETKSAQKLVR